MVTEQVVQLVLGFVLGATAATAGAWFWVRAQVKRMRQHQEHIEHARQQSAVQVTQARKQIEQLQHECHELRMAVMRYGTRPPEREHPHAEPPVDPGEAARRYVEAKLNAPAPEAVPDAFPDTLILRRPPSA